MHRKQLFAALAIGLGLAGAIAYATNRGGFAPLLATPSSGAAVSTSALPVPAAQRAAAVAANARASAKKPTGPTLEDVGDLDSFGRNVRWLGLTNAFVYTSTDCAGILVEEPEALCQQINDLATVTSFSFSDIARIKLPASASNSLLCHWFSPRVTVNFFNPTASLVPGRFAYSPTLTVENPVLDDPALIDPTTGAPFNGKLTTSMSAAESVNIPIEPGFPTTQNLRDSVVCQAGLISKRALVETYGLTAAQASSFFANPTTVRLNISGTSRFVSDAFYSLGLRIVGD